MPRPLSRLVEEFVDEVVQFGLELRPLIVRQFGRAEEPPEFANALHLLEQDLRLGSRHLAAAEPGPDLLPEPGRRGGRHAPLGVVLLLEDESARLIQQLVERLALGAGEDAVGLHLALGLCNRSFLLQESLDLLLCQGLVHDAMGDAVLLVLLACVHARVLNALPDALGLDLLALRAPRDGCRAVLSGERWPRDRGHRHHCNEPSRQSHHVRPSLSHLAFHFDRPALGPFARVPASGVPGQQEGIRRDVTRLAASSCRIAASVAEEFRRVGISRTVGFRFRFFPHG